MINIERAHAPGLLRFFRPEVEATIKLAVAVGLSSFIVLSFAWGYEQQRQAQNWRLLACTYRLQDSVRRAPFMSGVLNTPDPCATMENLGLRLDVPRSGPPVDVSAINGSSRARKGS